MRYTRGSQSLTNRRLVHLRQFVYWYEFLSRLGDARTELVSGVVVESFYYVFQMTGGAKEITREEMRSFKKVWAEYANPKTGYLERDKFVKFFGVCGDAHYYLKLGSLTSCRNCPAYSRSASIRRITAFRHFSRAP